MRVIIQAHVEKREKKESGKLPQLESLLLLLVLPLLKFTGVLRHGPKCPAE